MRQRPGCRGPGEACAARVHGLPCVERMSEPYTHSMHAKKCSAAGLLGVVLQRQRVQVRKSGVVYCGAIVEAWTTTNGGDCWTVETEQPERARFTVSVRNVRACGDAACSCALPGCGGSK